MENFQDWSAFDDCYPDAEDSYFDLDKGSYCTWWYSWENATEEDLVATKIVTEEDSSGNDAFIDTKDMMPWKDFVNLALDQEFKFAYDGLVEDDLDVDRHECFMYREDGLILYANSYWCDLDHAVVLGEISSVSENIPLLDLGSGSYSKSGSYVFETDVRNGMVSFLNFLEKNIVLLLPVWTEKRITMDILTENECEFVKGSDSERDSIIMKKLSLCCEEAKRIMAPYFEEDVNNDLAEGKPKNKPLKNIFNKLRR